MYIEYEAGFRVVVCVNESCLETTKLAGRNGSEVEAKVTGVKLSVHIQFGRSRQNVCVCQLLNV